MSSKLSEASTAVNAVTQSLIRGTRTDH